MTSTNKPLRIAIIGAGPSGLAQLRAFQAAQPIDSKPDVVCFEKQDNWGGLWNYSWRTGLDEFGEPVHGSMYRYLWSNGPKEGLEFADYSFEQHFGKQIASDVRVHDLVNDNEYTERFDHVIVATGHFSTPNVPAFDGMERFNGRVLHAHDFRDAMEFAGKDIVIVGTSYSAEDIGSQCWKYGAKSITVSHRTAAMGYDWPDNWTEVPLLTTVNGNTCTFKDGSTCHADAIILCTGYQHHFPFIEVPLRLHTANRLATANLYKGVVWNDNTQLFYLGMQDQWYTFNMFDAQAWYVRDIILGKIAIPDKAVRDTDIADRVSAEDALEDDYAAIAYQGSYVSELMGETDYPGFDVEGANQAFYQWKKHKKQNIMAFRDNAYQSVITGTMAPLHHTPWKDAMDDSLESYLENGD